MVRSLARSASPHGVIVQRYKREEVKGQGGYFIRGNAQVHLHLGIGAKSHLKIEGKFYNVNAGTELDVARMKSALENLLAFRESIANDRGRKRKYATAIQDCIEWFRDNGVVPAEPVPTPVASGGGGKEEKKDPDNPGGGYDDFFAPEKMSANRPVGDDDFM